MGAEVPFLWAAAPGRRRIRLRYHFDSLKVAELRRQIAHTQRERDKLDRRLNSLSRSLQCAETKRRPRRRTHEKT